MSNIRKQIEELENKLDSMEFRLADLQCRFDVDEEAEETLMEKIAQATEKLAQLKKQEEFTENAAQQARNAWAAACAT